MCVTECDYGIVSPLAGRIVERVKKMTRTVALYCRSLVLQYISDSVRSNAAEQKSGPVDVPPPSPPPPFRTANDNHVDGLQHACMRAWYQYLCEP